jgi:hypothetical protein
MSFFTVAVKLAVLFSIMNGATNQFIKALTNPVMQRAHSRWIESYHTYMTGQNISRER